MSCKFDKALIQRMIDRMTGGPHRGALTACITEIDSLELKVEEMQKTLLDIKKQIPAMQDIEEAESFRHNTGNMVLHLIDQALKGDPE